MCFCVASWFWLNLSSSASFQPKVGVALRDTPAVCSTQHVDQFEWRMPSRRVTDAVCRKLGCPTVVKSAAFPFSNEPYPDSYLFVNAQNQWSLSECRRFTKMWRQMVLLGCSHKMWVEWNWTIEKHHLNDYICPLPVTWLGVLSPSEVVAFFFTARLWRKSECQCEEYAALQSTGACTGKMWTGDEWMALGLGRTSQSLQLVSARGCSTSMPSNARAVILLCPTSLRHNSQPWQSFP